MEHAGVWRAGAASTTFTTPRWLGAGAVLLLATAGCADHKQMVFSDCYAGYIAHYMGPRPQGRPPDDFLVNMLDLCMMSHGYNMERTVSDPACASPATTTAACFHPVLPWAWLRSFFAVKASN